MVWTIKSSKKDTKYIVIKHKLKNINSCIGSVKFRGGYAVVEKDSKEHAMIRRLSLLKNAQEFPLTHLRKLPFITRALDIKTIYGADVYAKYMKEVMATEVVEKEQQEVVEHTEKNLCTCISKSTGKKCNLEASEESPSHYCRLHLLEDPKLEELGIHVPTLTKDEVKDFRVSVVKKLQKMKKENKF